MGATEPLVGSQAHDGITERAAASTFRPPRPRGDAEALGNQSEAVKKL